jgi:hydroxymethylglutaryl-CoA lyase
VLSGVLDRTGADVGLHLHDTRRSALVNTRAALDAGVRRFDSSIGGLGGSPFASTSAGNLATEELVLLLDDLGMPSGIDVDALGRVGQMLATLLGRDLPSPVSRLGPPAGWRGPAR